MLYVLKETAEKGYGLSQSISLPVRGSGCWRASVAARTVGAG
jgi:hypothetical protein